LCLKKEEGRKQKKKKKRQKGGLWSMDCGCCRWLESTESISAFPPLGIAVFLDHRS